MQEVLQASWSVNAADITVIPNGFDPASISRLSADREVDGRVGFIGTLHSKLNIDSFRSIGELGCVESVQVIGDGPRMDDLKALVKRQSDSKIELHGYLPNKEAYELLSTCQVAIYPVLPSEHTRMLSSRKIFDYAALGKAMVLDDVSDSDLWARFDDQDAAVFAEPDAPDAFANDVERLLTNAEARHEIAAQAEELAAEYTWAAHSHTLADIYDNWASWGR
jgi:glycosyltransferase involved in cell wall biosynthesis